MNWYVASLIASISLNIVGQVSLKAGALQGGQGIAVYLHKFTVLGFGTYFISALLYIYALKKIPLCIAFPCVSISYIFVSLLAHYIWGEPFTPKHLIALGFIGIGIYVLSSTQ